MILAEHGEKHDVETAHSRSQIHKEEVTIIEGALKFRDMLVRQIMTPVKNSFSLQADQKLSFQVKLVASIQFLTIFFLLIDFG